MYIQLPFLGGHLPRVQRHTQVSLGKSKPALSLTYFLQPPAFFFHPHTWNSRNACICWYSISSFLGLLQGGVPRRLNSASWLWPGPASSPLIIIHLASLLCFMQCCWPLPWTSPLTFLSWPLLFSSYHSSCLPCSFNLFFPTVINGDLRGLGQGHTILPLPILSYSFAKQSHPLLARMLSSDRLFAAPWTVVC